MTLMTIARMLSKCRRLDKKRVSKKRQRWICVRQYSDVLLALGKCVLNQSKIRIFTKKLSYDVYHTALWCPGPPAILIQMMEFSLFNSGFHLCHNIWWHWIHFMGSFCVFCNFSHQLSFGGSRGLKPTVLGNTYKRWHFLPICHYSMSIYFFVVPVSPNHLQDTILKMD